ncbi:MAG: glycoside hydrolase family 6 protein [Mycobacterium sp.]
MKEMIKKLVALLPASRQAAYYAMLRADVERLSALPRTWVYLDAGHAGWQPGRVMAERLRRAGVARTRGFALNVSAFGRSADEARYGQRIAASLPGQTHFVIDTSRNGNGPLPGSSPDGRCNPPGRALGQPPTTDTHNPLIDAYLWVKNPGVSDGACVPGAPPAGQFWTHYALGLIDGNSP